MNADSIEICVGDVSDIEARVYARYVGNANGVVLRGTLRGPFCDNSRTLPADFPFRDLGPREAGSAEAVVTDPCTWSPELPHLYDVHVEAWQGSRLLAGYHDKIGLRRLAPRRPVDFAPGTG